VSAIGFKALLWKDYRLNRPILVMGATLFLAPYAIIACVAWYDFWPTLPPVSKWPYALLPASLVSLALSLVTLVTLSGSSVARERADRSAEFLCALPPSRLHILASKIVMVLAPVAVVWAANLVLAWRLVPDQGPAPGGVGRVGDHIVSMAAAASLLLGAGLLGSATLESPAMATSLAVALTIGVIFTMSTISSLSGWTPAAFQERTRVVFFVLGGLCFALGAGFYLRRVTP
jgi:ABC-type Na+ efflux pump permease subunit